MDQAQREELAQQIRKAFARTPYPKGGFNSEEWAQLCPYKPWEFVSFEILSRHWGDFYDHHTLPEFRYLLAPLLIGMLLQPEHAGMLHDAVIRRLAPPGKKYRDGFIRNVLNTMTYQESVAVSAFLNAYLDIIADEYMMCDEDDLLNAMEFWDTLAHLPSEKFKGVTIKGGK